MSRLYFITCRDCKLISNPAAGKNSAQWGMFDPPLQAVFLHEHTGHTLEFMDEHKTSSLLFDGCEEGWCEVISEPCKED